ncbi:MAG TPA: SDR family NAD(P)-dependent oxidoreductase [Acidimicrobiales bacterium]|nr:SDR family NAD(P)-dependent oxidoreductase [Acidimicrobiales bacterium]
MDATTLINSFRVDGKVAVITGAGSGIGKASALALAGAGATVVCADIFPETATATAEEIVAAGGAAEGVGLDVSNRVQVDELATRIAAERGGIHIWANIAGIMVEGPFLDAPEADLDRILAVNLKGVFFGCQAAGRVMVTQPEGGSIINASSAAADAPSPNIVSYAICKAGVVQMTKSLAIEIGKKGVRVNAVAPGFVLTGMTGRYFVRPDGSIDEEMQEAVVGPMRRHTPLRSIGEPEDIAAAVLYLASDAARFMTGQVVRPNGGVAMV